MKILIIDDEIDLSLLLRNYLVKKGFEVEIAHSLSDGLLCLEEFSPHILFLDNNLPDGEGWRVAPDILQKHANLKLFLISAYHPDAPEMGEGTNYTILEKPISFSDLDEKLLHLKGSNSKSPEAETEQL